MTNRKMRIIGIDPGYDRLGIAIIEQQNGKEVLLYSDCVTTSPKSPFADRLGIIGAEFEKVLKKWKPEALAIENLFFTNNQKTAMRVAETRGAICYLATKNKLPVMEFTPLQVKTCVAGHGGADKKQVTFMTQKLIKIDKKIKHDDEYDAIAIGLTGLANVNILKY